MIQDWEWNRDLLKWKGAMPQASVEVATTLVMIIVNASTPGIQYCNISIYSSPASLYPDRSPPQLLIIY